MKLNLSAVIEHYDDYIAKAMQLVLLLNFALSLFLGWIFQGFTSALLLGALLCAGPLIIQQLKPHSWLSQAAMAFAYMSFVTLQVHLSQGLIEIHFGYFVLLAILFAYLSVLPILVAAAAAAVYHLMFAYMQTHGGDVYLFDQGNVIITRAGIPVFILVHAAYVVVESVVLIYMAVITRPIVVTGQQIIRTNNAMLRQDGRIDLAVTIAADDNELIARYQRLIGAVRETIRDAVAITDYLSGSLQVLQQTYKTVNTRVAAQLQQIETIHGSTGQVTDAANALFEISAYLRQKTDDLTALKDESVVTVQDSATMTGRTSGFMAATSESMSRVDSDTLAISGMVESIQSIAEQTNLLALNAAIEAARAGEQGRGFAVVADEVRALATRTHQATEEINSLIEQLTRGAAEAVTTMNKSVEEIRASQQLNETAAGQMSALGSRIDDVNQSSRQIASAAEQQTDLSQQIAQALSELSSASQDMVTAIAAGDASLADVSQRFSALSASIRKFNA